jgi:superfamily II DNA or RNA helicase
MSPDTPSPALPAGDAADLQDPFLYDTDRLHAIAPEGVVRKGLEYFKQDRVMDLRWNEGTLCASVEGSRPDAPYAVELDHDSAGGLRVSCGCDAEEGTVCKHAVAVLYRYAAQLAPATELTSAMDAAIAERVQRGHSEVRVQHVSGEPWFGTWHAQSIVSTTHRPQRYTVHIRSLQRRWNYCTCPDLATNQLGTCKHIEAVLHAIRKRPDYARIAHLPPPFPFVYLAWDVDDAPQVRLQRVADMDPELAGLLDRHFDAAGRLRGELPDDYLRFSDAVYGRTDVHLGEDAQGHVLRLAADAAHQRRAEKIRAEITRFGGHLPGIRARLYPYQVEGVAFLAATGRALLADDMGLGKTLQTIAAAAWLARNADVERVLVICPASLKHQWAREIERFTEHQAQVIQGGPEARAAQYRQPATFVVANYELLLRDLSVINEDLRPDLLVLDEAQRIKNWRTKVANFVKAIPSRYAFVLTGTPLENRLEDLYSLMQVVDPRVLGPLWRYLIDFHVTDERGKVLGYRNLSTLRRRIAPVMLRRDRRLVREQLPDRIEQRLDVPLSFKQQELHDSGLMAASALAQIAQRRPLTPSEQNRLMAGLQQARMACDAAGLVDKETQGSPKLDELAGLLEDLCLGEGQKVVIFSQWERMTAMVEDVVRRLGLGFVRLHGGVPSAKRGDLMDRFREDDATRVFISTDAGASGLNLQAASALINLDVPWNPAVLDQRIARVHRLGQKASVQIINLVAADAYEEQVLGLVGSKRDLFVNVVTEEASEDVVGVSKKLLERLVQDLAPLGGPRKEEPQAEEAAGEAAMAALVREAPAEAAAQAPSAEETEQDQAVRRAIEAVQGAFGPRIERIVGSGGGLLVVMDPVDAEAERLSLELSEELPVAVIEPRAYNALVRLGAASPLKEARMLYEAGQAPDQPRIPPLLALARQRLDAAQVLVDQGSSGPAVELLASAMLAAAAARAELHQAPSSEEASVWLYAEAVPRGLVTAEQAAAVTRALALRQAPSVPDALVQAVLDDARGLMEAPA